MTNQVTVQAERPTDRSDLHEQAESLRAQGFSYRQIAAELKIPVSTAHSWTKHIQFETEQEPEPISVYPLTSFDYAMSAEPLGVEPSTSTGSHDPRTGASLRVQAWTYGPGDDELPYRDGNCIRHGVLIREVYLRHLDMWHMLSDCPKCKTGGNN